MNKEIIIDKTEQHELVAVREEGKLVDLFFDFIENKKFYPYLTLVVAKVIRSFGKKGFFIRLPNKETGFLSTKKHYTLGEKVIVVAKSFFDEEKLQRFSDKFIYITKFFVFKNGRPSLFLSKKLENH